MRGLRAVFEDDQCVHPGRVHQIDAHEAASDNALSLRGRKLPPRGPARLDAEPDRYQPR
jgi:hypothetical protein